MWHPSTDASWTPRDLGQMASRLSREPRPPSPASSIDPLDCIDESSVQDGPRSSSPDPLEILSKIPHKRLALVDEEDVRTPTQTNKKRRIRSPTTDAESRSDQDVRPLSSSKNRRRAVIQSDSEDDRAASLTDIVKQEQMDYGSSDLPPGSPAAPAPHEDDVRSVKGEEDDVPMKSMSHVEDEVTPVPLSPPPTSVTPLAHRDDLKEQLETASVDVIPEEPLVVGPTEHQALPSPPPTAHAPPMLEDEDKGSKSPAAALPIAETTATVETELVVPSSPASIMEATNEDLGVEAPSKPASPAMAEETMTAGVPLGQMQEHEQEGTVEVTSEHVDQSVVNSPAQTQDIALEEALELSTSAIVEDPHSMPEIEGEDSVAANALEIGGDQAATSGIAEEPKPADDVAEVASIEGQAAVPVTDESMDIQDNQTILLPSAEDEAVNDGSPPQALVNGLPTADPEPAASAIFATDLKVGPIELASAGPALTAASPKSEIGPEETARAVSDALKEEPKGGVSSDLPARPTADQPLSNDRKAPERSANGTSEAIVEATVNEPTPAEPVANTSVQSTEEVARPPSPVGDVTQPASVPGAAVALTTASVSQPNEAAQGTPSKAKPKSASKPKSKPTETMAKEKKETKSAPKKGSKKTKGAVEGLKTADKKQRSNSVSETSQPSPSARSSVAPPDAEDEEDDDKVYCVCRKPFSEEVDDEVMVACDECDNWYHPGCVGIKANQVDSVESYICKDCEKITDKRTVWLKVCKRDTCKNSTTGRSSKYCSSTCAFQHMASQIPPDASKKLLKSLTSTFIGFPKPMISMTVTHHLSASPLLRTVPNHSAVLQEQIDAAQARIGMVQKRIELLQSVITRCDSLAPLASAAQAAPSKKSKSARSGAEDKACGWDVRLIWDDEQVREWVAPAEGAMEVEQAMSDVCMSSRRRCDRHSGWQKTMTGSLDLELGQLESRRDDLIAQKDNLAQSQENDAAALKLRESLLPRLPNHAIAT